MLDLYYRITPNGQIFREEGDLPHRIVPVNISAGERTDGTLPSSLGRRGRP
jgi:hypothetical protein